MAARKSDFSTLPGLMLLSGLYLLGGLVIGVSSAQDDPLSLSRELPSILKNQEMQILEVVLAPGESSPPHRHNAHVFVYILEGEVEMQVSSGEPVRLQMGDTFFESPDDIHLIGRNLSADKPAKFLVHMLKEVGVPAYMEVL